MSKTIKKLKSKPNQRVVKNVQPGKSPNKKSLLREIEDDEYLEDEF